MNALLSKTFSSRSHEGHEEDKKKEKCGQSPCVLSFFAASRLCVRKFFPENTHGRRNQGLLFIAQGCPANKRDYPGDRAPQFAPTLKGLRKPQILCSFDKRCACRGQSTYVWSPTKESYCSIRSKSKSTQNECESFGCAKVLWFMLKAPGLSPLNQRLIEDFLDAPARFMAIHQSVS